MKIKIITITIIITAAMLLTSCSETEVAESKNMEQLYKENGIPVKIETIKAQQFTLELPFTATLTGLQQSSASAMIGGRIEKVLIKVGDYVNKDQVLVEFPEDAPAGQYKQATAAYEMAKSTFERMQNLYELGGISKQDLEGIETQYTVAAANLDASSQMLKVRAPISGIVTAVNVRETESVKSETQLVTVSNTSKMKAKVLLTESEVCQVTEGQKVVAIWNEVKLEGKVAQVAVAKDMKTRAFIVDLEFDNTKNLCKSGVMADVKISTYSNSNAILLPRKTVLKDAMGHYVYVLKEGNAIKRNVIIGKENGKLEIIDGLMIGDKVIVEGYNKLTNNTKVNVI